MPNQHELAQDAAPPTTHHGEYKIPEGKLVVVDLKIVQARLRDVQLSGDFFMEPPEALDAINAALEGLPHDAADGQIEAAVRAATPDVLMYGITVAGIAVVVRRALA